MVGWCDSIIMCAGVCEGVWVGVYVHVSVFDRGCVDRHSPGLNFVLRQACLLFSCRTDDIFITFIQDYSTLSTVKGPSHLSVWVMQDFPDHVSQMLSSYRGVQYMHCVMHKCIMVKVWENETYIRYVKARKFYEIRGELWKIRGK